MSGIDDPARAAVVVVAIEDCGVFSGDALRGPVADAIRWFEWAEALKVPPERIRLFISPSPAGDKMLADWHARRCKEDVERHQARPRVGWTKATRDHIVNFLTSHNEAGLSGLQPSRDDKATLLIAWSGHGVVDDNSARHDRQLFFADGTPDMPMHLDVTKLSRMLNARYPNFGRRLLVIAACATAATRSFGTTDAFGDAESLGNLGDLVARGQQYTMAATVPGEVELFEQGPDGLARSRFLSRLFDRLGPPVAGCWPDFAAALERTKADFPDETPASWLWGDGISGFNDTGGEILGTARGTRLARALRRAGFEQDWALLESAYIAASPDRFGAAERLQHAGRSAFAVAALLERSPPAGDRHDPLRRMAFELLARTNLGSQALADWLRFDHVDDAEAHAEVAARKVRQQAPVPPRFLLIDGMPIDDDSGSIDAWLFTTPDAEPLPIVRDRGLFLIDRDHAWPEVLDEIIALAGTLSNRAAPLVIELAVPEFQLDTPGLEAQSLGAANHRLPLRRRYPVVRRLAERMRTLQDDRSRLRHAGWGSDVDEWCRVAGALWPRLNRSGLRLISLAPDALIDGDLTLAIEQEADGNCVHVADGWDGERLHAGAVLGLKIAGTPYACWATGAWCEDDARQLEASLADKRGEDIVVALHALQRQNKFDKHPFTRLVLLWDDPRRHPASYRLGTS